MKKLKEESENEIHVRQKKGDIKGLIKEVAKMKGCFFNKTKSRAWIRYPRFYTHVQTRQME